MNEIRMRKRVVKNQNKIVPEIRLKFTMFSLYLCNNSDQTFVSCINIRWVPREVLKTTTSSLGFQHLSRDPANVNARKHV